MGGGGAIQGMNEQIDYNRKLRDRSRSKIKWMRKRLEDAKRKRARIVESELSEAELRRLREEIRQDIRRFKRRRVFVYCVATLIGLAAIYYLYTEATSLIEYIF